MAKIVVGSPSLTQPLLFYMGLGQVMLDNIDGVLIAFVKSKKYSYITSTKYIIFLYQRCMLMID
jgi:hypothetical protein